MKTSALAVIDMQKFFFMENPSANEARLTQECNVIIDISRKANVPVVFIETRYRSDRRDWPSAFAADRDSWCSNLIDGKASTALVEGLDVKAGDPFVTKTRFSAFYSTDLENILRSLRCEHLFLIGYSADVCVRFTAVDAYNRGFEVTTIYEGIESFREPKDASVEYLQWLIDARCISTRTYASLLRAES